MLKQATSIPTMNCYVAGNRLKKKAVGRGAKLQFVHEQTHLKGQRNILLPQGY